MFRTQNLYPGSKNVFDSRQKHFCFRAAKFVSATHVFRAAKLGNICIRNNVSATMFPSLARPLRNDMYMLVGGTGRKWLPNLISRDPLLVPKDESRRDPGTQEKQS